jgi:hypothetical protein
LATLIAVVAAIWATGALYFDLPAPFVIRIVAAAVWLVGFVIAWIWLPHRRWSGLIVGVVFLCILGWWLSIPPRQDRDWKPDVAVLPNAVIEGDQVTINDIRNFDWRSLTDLPLAMIREATTSADCKARICLSFIGDLHSLPIRLRHSTSATKAGFASASKRARSAAKPIPLSAAYTGSLN